ncbi:MAG: hypothetical protein NT064_01210 [Proteobacteria bacterium]|nr:hypothetical protein [Pseudomonadota bacterium]
MATTRYSIFGLLAISALFGATAQAADPSLCAAIADSASRLICYDAALRPAPATPAAPVAKSPPAAPAPLAAPAPAPVAKAAPAVAAVSPAAVAAPAAEPAKRAGITSMFGLLPKRQKQDRPQLQATVVDIKVRSDGQIVTLNNEQVWMITEPQRDPFAEPDDEIVIDPASLGSFLMSRASGGASVRVKRLR